MDYTDRERHREAIYRFKNGMLPSDFLHRHVVLSFQEDAIGIRLRDGHRRRQDDMGFRLSTQQVDVSPITADPGEILAGVPEDELAKPAPDHDPGIAGGNTVRVYNFDVTRLTVPA